MTLAAELRVSPDPTALASAEQQMAYTGEIRGPVIVVDNIGDLSIPEAYKERRYTRTARGAGNEHLLRTTWIASAGHGNQTVLERLAGFVKLIERTRHRQAELDVGGCHDRGGDGDRRRVHAWPLGVSRHIETHPLKPLREWDGKDFGTWLGPRGLIRLHG